jgi:hypothetical protein
MSVTMRALHTPTHAAGLRTFSRLRFGSLFFPLLCFETALAATPHALPADVVGGGGPPPPLKRSPGAFADGIDSRAQQHQGSAPHSGVDPTPVGPAGSAPKRMAKNTSAAPTVLRCPRMVRVRDLSNGSLQEVWF